MSLKVTFGRVRGEPEVVGPYARLTFLGGDLRSGTDLTPLATHTDHYWKTSTDRFSRLDVPGPLLIELSRQSEPSRTYGPYTAFSCVDGVAYVEGRVFAFMDNELGDWYCIEDEHHWKTLSLVAKK